MPESAAEVQVLQLVRGQAVTDTRRSEPMRLEAIRKSGHWLGGMGLSGVIANGSQKVTLTPRSGSASSPAALFNLPVHVSSAARQSKRCALNARLRNFLKCRFEWGS